MPAERLPEGSRKMDMKTSCLGPRNVAFGRVVKHYPPLGDERPGHAHIGRSHVNRRNTDEESQLLFIARGLVEMMQRADEMVDKRQDALLRDVCADRQLLRCEWPGRRFPLHAQGFSRAKGLSSEEPWEGFAVLDNR